MIKQKGANKQVMDESVYSFKKSIMKGSLRPAPSDLTSAREQYLLALIESGGVLPVYSHTPGPSATFFNEKSLGQLQHQGFDFAANTESVLKAQKSRNLAQAMNYLSSKM